MTGDRARIDALPTPLLARAASPYVALSGAANVVMQLSRPEIGYAVADSQVVGARLFDDPRRRMRTTIGYLAIATSGTAAERAAYRTATNGSHAQVPGAFGHELQRWVATCLFHGLEEAYEAVWGPLGSERSAFLGQAVVLGSMLQVPASSWPTDRAAVATYWRSGLAAASIDDHVRHYLMRVVRMEYAGPRISAAVAERRVWLTTGFLPPQIREQMQLGWSLLDQARFDRFTRRFAGVVRHCPRPVRTAPFNGAHRGIRRRLAQGEPPF